MFFLDLANGNEDIFIQNEKLSLSKNISGKTVKIGSSVTDGKEEGEVVFEKGRYVIRAIRSTSVRERKSRKNRKSNSKTDK